MDLNLIDDNHKFDRDFLMPISQRNYQIIKVKIGIEGNLIEDRNEFIFYSFKTNKELRIKIENPEFTFTRDLVSSFIFLIRKEATYIYLQKWENFTNAIFSKTILNY